MPPEHLEKIKNQLNKKALKTRPLGNIIRITGISQLNNFINQKGEQYLPKIEPYITGTIEGEKLKQHLKEYLKKKII